MSVERITQSADFTPLGRDAGPEEVMERIEAAGIVGMGGGGYPTARKIREALAADADWMIGNGMASEPGVTADVALLREHADDVAAGLHIVARCIGATHTALAVPTDTDVPGGTRVGLAYPAGEEKKLVAHLTGREVPTAGYASDVGVLVLNVSTLFAIHDAVARGRALQQRLVTVAGTDRWVAIGTPLADLPLQEPSAGEREGLAPRMREPSAGEREGLAPRMEEPSAGEREGTAPRMEEPSAGEREGLAPRKKEPSAGEREGPAPRMEEPSAGEREGLALRTEEPADDGYRIQGELTGRDVARDAVVDPSTFSVDLPRGDSWACIRCGWCAHACPEGLAPERLHRAFEADAADATVLDCIECGACTAACPSRLDLVNEFRAIKTRMRREEMAMEQAERARQRSDARTERLARAANERDRQRAERMNKPRQW